MTAHGPGEVVIHDSTHFYYHCRCGQIFGSLLAVGAHQEAAARSDLPWHIEEETEEGETIMLSIQNAQGDYLLCYTDESEGIDDKLRATFATIVEWARR